ncbi:MAG: hypothetical protein ACPG47_11375, partial [Leucothrix sp.]
SGLVQATSASLNQGVINGSSTTTVTLLNQSNQPYVLDAAQPLSLKKIHGWVAVELNKVPAQSLANISNRSSVTLAAGQRRSFTINSEFAPALEEQGGYIFVNYELGEHEDENTVPMATFDVVIV